MLLEWMDVTGTNKAVPLSHISFTLEEGYIMAVVGKNGAGKTTMMRAMMKEAKEYTGRMLLDGLDIHENHTACMEDMAYIADEAKFFMNFTANQNVLLLKNCYKEFQEETYHKWMKRMELSGGKILGKMSRGEYIKFQMAFAIAHSPKLYMIDEATAGMDVVFSKEFHRILRELLVEDGVSVLMVSHNEDEVKKMADYIAVLEGGRLVSVKENI